MKRFAALALMLVFAQSVGASDQDALEITVIDGRVSIHAEAVPLGRLLGLLDRVAGTNSTVADQLINRNVSVQFSGLDLDRAVKKIFEGLPLDYFVLGNTRIVVTAVSGTLSGQAAPASPAGASNPSPQPFVSQSQGQRDARAINRATPFQANAAARANNPVPGNAPQQPAIIQTPFGPLVNPRANQNAQQQPGSPLAMPGQSSYPFGTTTGSPGTPSVTSPGMPTSPGTQTTPGSGQPNDLGNTSPKILDLNKKSPSPPPPGKL